MKKRFPVEHLGIAGPMLAAVLLLFFTARREVEWIESPFLIAAMGCVLAAAGAVIYGLAGLAIGAAVLTLIALFVYPGYTSDVKLAFVLPAMGAWLALSAALIRKLRSGWRRRRLVRVGDEIAALRARLEQLERLNAAGGIAEVLGAASGAWMSELETVVETAPRLLAALPDAARAEPELKKLEIALRSVQAGLAAQTLLTAGLTLESEKETSLAAVVEHAAAAAKDFYDRHDIALELDLADSGGPFAADGALLAKAVENLLINAAEAHGRGGKVAVHAASDYRGGRGVIEVIDHGSGVNSDVMPHIFKPFFSTKPERLGLGLAVTREIVSRLGGSVAVAANENRGMTFRIRLPMRRPGLAGAMAERHAAPRPEPAAPAAPAHPAKPVQVVLPMPPQPSPEPAMQPPST